MIELRMQNTKTLHETLIDAAKEQYGDVPIQISGNSENMTLSVDTPDEDTEKRQAMETGITAIFSKRELRFQSPILLWKRLNPHHLQLKK